MDPSERKSTAMKGVCLNSHVESFMESLLKLKKENNVTDVTLVLPDKSTIPCHKVVLMAASNFFEIMFQSGMKEVTDQDVRLDFADADTIRTLVDFFYTGVIDVTPENAKELAAASEFLCCEHLKPHCEKFLNGYVGSSNCIDLYKFAKLHNLPKLQVTAFENILIHFKEFALLADFETFTEAELLEIVSNDGLIAENEDIIFAAVIHWVDADPAEQRKEAFSRIAPLIRFPFCTPATLTAEVCRNSLMLSSGCIELALEALSSPYHCNSQHAIHNARCVARLAFKGNKKERLIRMIDLDSLGKIWFSITTHDTGGQIGKWTNILPEIKSTLRTFAVSTAGIYWVDYNGGLHLLDVKTKKVIPITWEPANVDSTIVIIDEKITAFGGSKSGTPLKTVESFNTRETNPKWKHEPEMLHALLKPNVVRFANKVYVFGGKSEDQDGLAQVTQEFDLTRSKWRTRSEMPGPCTSGNTIALNDKIFVVGGEERVCYSYEPFKDVWTALSQPTEVYNCFTTATAWNGKILLGNTENVEEYDPKEDTWCSQTNVLPKNPDVFQMVLHTVCT